MLQNLHVKNLALIDEAEVDFHDGLNVLSGETGAGKSIIIGSINLALGEKIPKEILRENTDSALVELIFDVESESIRQEIKKLDIEMEDSSVILSRKITGGRSVAKINGEAVSAGKLKEVASLLIDIHGQHEHQSLLSKRNHLMYLDRYAGEELLPIKSEVQELYNKYKKLKEDYINSNLDDSERKREASLLEYEINEITEAQLVAGEDQKLEADYQKYVNGKKILEAVTNAHSLTGGDGDCASELIGRAVRELTYVSKYDQDIEGFENQLLELDNMLSDLNRELASYLDDTEFDTETFFQMEKRLDLINHLKSKYGNNISEILAELKKKEERFQVLLDYDAYLEKLKQELNKCTSLLDAKSVELSEIRKKAALKMEKEIVNALKELNFLDVRFAVSCNPIEGYSAQGIDDVEFLISTNPGEPLKPLDKIASGGEISRIMLGLKSIMADKDDISTLIFDEIDTGISGRTAQMVSEKMNSLSRNHQLICITHLPQIAAMADEHFLIEKNVNDGRTISSIHLLNEDESIHELARMLGGVSITETVLNNAKEMKELANSKK